MLKINLTNYMSPKQGYTLNFISSVYLFLTFIDLFQYINYVEYVGFHSLDPVFYSVPFDT